MKNMKCYGKKKTIIPKEKSFIKKFFDGNESSNMSNKGSEGKDQGASASRYRENIYHIFDSPVSFTETFPLEQKKRSCVRSVAKPNEDQKNYSSENKENSFNLFESPVPHCDESFSGQKKTFGKRKALKTKQALKSRVNRKKYVRKKDHGIQHLSTKYCKSLQPCWEEFEKHDLNIERPGKTNHPIVMKQSNIFKSSKDAKNCVESLPCTSIANNSNCGESNQSAALPYRITITPKNIITTSRLYNSSKKTFQSSGELFEKTPKYKASVKKKNIKIKKTKPANKCHDEFSYKMVTRLEEKINTCMQNIDLSETCSSYSETSSSKNKANNINGVLPSDNTTQERVPVQCTKTVSKSSNVDCILSNGNVLEETVPIRCSKTVSHVEIIPNGKDFSDTIEEVSRRNRNEESVSVTEMCCISSNDGFSKTVSDKSQKMLHENVRILHSVDSDMPHRLQAKNISSKPVCINESEQNFIQSKNSKEREVKDYMSSINLPCESKFFHKSSGISLNKKVDSLNPEEKTLKNSMCKNEESHTLSPNVSNISQNYKSFGLKLKEKFATSTPVTKKNKVQDFFNAEIIVLSDDENICEQKTYPTPHSSSCEKAKGNKHLKPLKTKTLKNSSINCLNKPANTEILKSLPCPVTPNLLKSRTSLIMPSKNVIHSRSCQSNQSLLNLSSANSVLEKEKSDVFTKAKLLELCDQDFVMPFADIYDWKSFKVKKIGEGTYGEVFMLTKGKKSSVLKVIAISEDSNVKNLQGLSSVYSEVKISKSLSELRCNDLNKSTNFVKIIRSSVVCGLYPDILMKAWDDFSLDRSTYNYRPDIYNENQLFAILELEYGGNDMSFITLRNSIEAEIILKQIAVSLAVAEEEFSFEHRDLHLGNILVRRNRSKKVSYKIRGKDISFQCLGLQVTIIDFTLSLLSDKGYIYYYDLADDSLFDQTGDYQFDVYKSMRRHLENKWEECSLYSNVLWLKYLCKKMKEFKYTHPTAVTHKRGLKAIDSFNSQLMKCSCALECLEKCGITKTTFKRSISDTTRNSILVSRNSIQKSKLSVCN